VQLRQVLECARSEFAMHADIDELLSRARREPVLPRVLAHVGGVHRSANA
jgi:hypothetical protein